MLNCLKFHQIIHDTTAYMHQQVPCTRKKWYLGLMAYRVCCKLAPTLARQMWRHNYATGRNEYLISTLSETAIPWVYSLQFLFKSTHYSRSYERKCERVFFSEHSVFLGRFSYFQQTEIRQLIRISGYGGAVIWHEYFKSIL